MLNVAVCGINRSESEALKLKILKSQTDVINNITVFNDGDELVFFVEENISKVITVFLDIEELNGEGIVLARKLMGINPQTQIIFISGKAKHYLDVYEVPHLYYMEKPVQMERVSKALEVAAQQLGLNSKRVLPIVKREATYRVPLTEIKFFEKERRLIHVYTIERKYSFYGKYGDIEPYTSNPFCRCHNSYIVNFMYVEKLEGSCFYIKGGSKIPISRNRLKEAKNSYISYLSRKQG